MFHLFKSLNCFVICWSTWMLVFAWILCIQYFIHKTLTFVLVTKIQTREWCRRECRNGIVVINTSYNIIYAQWKFFPLFWFNQFWMKMSNIEFISDDFGFDTSHGTLKIYILLVQQHMFLHIIIRLSHFSFWVVFCCT